MGCLNITSEEPTFLMLDLNILEYCCSSFRWGNIPGIFIGGSVCLSNLMSEKSSQNIMFIQYMLYLDVSIVLVVKQLCHLMNHLLSPTS